MNRRQKKLVANLVIVGVFTTAVVVGFSNIKNSINRSEAIRAMQIIGTEILDYRDNFGTLPNQSYIDRFIEQIKAVRLGEYQYRAVWIEYDCDPNNTILMYTKKHYSGWTKSGGIILWLNGRVQWFSKKDFDRTIALHQSKQEIKWLQKQLNNDALGLPE